MKGTLAFALVGILITQSDCAYAQELSCELSYNKAELYCSVVSDQVSILGYQINRGKCDGAEFNYQVLFKDARILGVMTFDERKSLQFQVAQIRHIIEGRAERYKGFEPSAKVEEMNDQEISGLFKQLMSTNIVATGTELRDELIVPTPEFTSALLSDLWLNFNIPVIGNYHFSDQFKVEANCEILEVQFDTPKGSIVFRAY